MDGFQMPQAIAGDRSEVTPDRDGAENTAAVTGGLVIFMVLVSIAAMAKNRIMDAASNDENTENSVSFKGSL